MGRDGTGRDGSLLYVASSNVVSFSQYPFVLLGRERHCESEVTQHTEPGQVSRDPNY